MVTSTISEIIQLYPYQSAIAATLLVTAAAILLFFNLYKRNSLKKTLKSLGDEILPDMEAFHKRFSKRFLYRNSVVIDSLPEENKQKIIELTGYDTIWIERFRKRNRKRDFERILRYASNKGLFDCFITALKKKKAADRLFTWMKESDQHSFLRRLAYSSRGRNFDTRAGYKLLKDYIDNLRELTGDPEHYVRLFAYRLLLHDEDSRSARALRDAFLDSHNSVRSLAASGFNEPETDRRNELYSSLYRLAVADSVENVRETAWNRIKREFADIHSVDTSKLSDTEIIHLIELFDQSSPTDEAEALPYLESENAEIRFAAARYLDSAGALKRLLLNVTPGDRKASERIIRLLSNAAELRISSFFEVLKQTESMRGQNLKEILSVCASILQKHGPPSAVTSLCTNVFPLSLETPETVKLYRLTAEAACSRGDRATMDEIEKELSRRNHDSRASEILLESLPRPIPERFLSKLFIFLEDSQYPCYDSLKTALLSTDTTAVVSRIFFILKTAPEKYNNEIRLRALRILAELKMPYCLQTILENSTLLDPEIIEEIAHILADFPSNQLSSRFRDTLQSDDAAIRAVVIRMLPIAGGKDFNKEAREALHDADPDIRISAVWALTGYKDSRALSSAAEMLRDPVERVRVESARAIGAHGPNDALKQLKQILDDSNEIDKVRSAAIEGLAFSGSSLSVDILTDRLENEERLKSEIIVGLSGKTDRKLISRLIENFKDASPGLREKIILVFKHMGEKGENSIEDLLREDIPSLKPLAAEILEATGCTEKYIRSLSNRDPKIRLKSAGFLTLVGTKSAFRGMVMAARDPDEDVRVMVIKALERLEKGEGKEILDELTQDPDKKVRTYTAWALERIRAKNL